MSASLERPRARATTQTERRLRYRSRHMCRMARVIVHRGSSSDSAGAMVGGKRKAGRQVQISIHHGRVREPLVHEWSVAAAAAPKHGRIRKNRAPSRRRPIVAPPQHAGIAVVMPLMNPRTHQRPLSARIHQLQRHEAAHALWRRHNAVGRDVRRRSPTTVKVMKMTGSRSSWRLPRPGECQIC